MKGLFLGVLLLQAVDFTVAQVSAVTNPQPQPPQPNSQQPQSPQLNPQQPQPPQTNPQQPQSTPQQPQLNPQQPQYHNSTPQQPQSNPQYPHSNPQQPQQKSPFPPKGKYPPQGKYPPNGKAPGYPPGPYFPGTPNSGPTYPPWDPNDYPEFRDNWYPTQKGGKQKKGPGGKGGDDNDDDEECPDYCKGPWYPVGKSSPSMKASGNIRRDDPEEFDDLWGLMRAPVRISNAASKSTMGGFQWPSKQNTDATPKSESGPPPPNARQGTVVMKSSGMAMNSGDDELPDWLTNGKTRGGNRAPKSKAKKGKMKCPKKCRYQSNASPPPSNTGGPSSLYHANAPSSSAIQAAPAETQAPIVSIAAISQPTTLMTMTSEDMSASPTALATPGPHAGSCPAQCTPTNPQTNRCSVTTGCITTGGNAYYCACRAGYRFTGLSPSDARQFHVPGLPYVYGPAELQCDTLCRDQTCTEVGARSECK